MKPLKFAIFGTGFWSRYQLAGWHEVGGVACVAAYNRTISKAKILAAAIPGRARGRSIRQKADQWLQPSM